MEQDEDITLMLHSLSEGDEAALDRLFVSLYAQLHNMAHARRRGWSGEETLHTTALVHEAYLKLAGGKSLKVSDRRHFFATAGRAMRQILINHAEKRCAAKRGGSAANTPLDEERCAVAGAEEELLALDGALTRLEEIGERPCRVVECRFFAGLNVEETAEALAISPATVKRDWAVASAWLTKELSADDG
ncbi:MAG: ECF-type sigma factor [Gammaproteobacteria bacterium]|nr:ECF-type sigma factor [Gammaproteobacteria bacterium]